MNTRQAVQNADIRETFAPAARAAPDIKIISHSNVVYWWPAWVVGFAVALITSLQGQDVAMGPDVVERIHPSNNPGILFIATLVLLVIFTNSKLRGIYSIVTLVTAAFFIVLLAWLGWWDSILHFIPQLSARANVGFYLLFSTGLLAVWLLAFFLFDRLTIWRVRPGQIIEEHLIGGQARSYDANGAVFERRGQDLFHDIILGFGAGDLTLKIGGSHEETIQIPNVLFVARKMKEIEKLIAVKPDMAHAS
ncbi:hypothetical protein [Hyphomicrobium sp. MC1]|uniref:hypothetical protein n=1 Tax=Hyphomicrobium sp. (strain MC1) TaxID=717785 RepID=UPI000213E69C|nr:hypothetical protein [Hyphomicrobium sp. MC1]CCB66521.1 conserved membrane protein of unknown function [Hyphomicrobium sp. MC1]